MPTLAIIAVLLAGFVIMTVVAIALLVAWTRANREVEQLRRRVNDLRVRGRG